MAATGVRESAGLLNFTLDGVPFLYNGQEVEDSTATPWLETKAISFPGVREEAALSSGDLWWVNNTAPESVLSFVRRRGDAETPGRIQTAGLWSGPCETAAAGYEIETERPGGRGNTAGRR